MVKVTVLFLTLGNSSVGMAQWAGVELPAVTGSYGVGTGFYLWLIRGDRVCMPMEV